MPDSFFERLIAFYNNHPSSQSSQSHIWDVVVGQHHGPLVHALQTRNIPNLRGVLENAYANLTTFGMDFYDYSFYGKSRTPATDLAFQKCTLHVLERLAISLGLQPMRNAWSCTNYNFDPEKMLPACESDLGFKLDHCGAGGLIGVSMMGRFIPHKLLCDSILVAAVRKLVIWPAIDVVEIGGGCGWIGVIATKMGAHHYHSIDLPSSCVIQAYMLGCELGQESIWLLGENHTDKQTIWIHGLDKTKALSEIGQFGVAVNQNSFPEIAVNDQIAIRDFISAGLRPGGIFFSMNREEMNPTTPLFKQSANLKLESRNLWWMQNPFIVQDWQAAYALSTSYIAEVWRKQ